MTTKTKTPSKRWRVTTADRSADYASEQQAYDDVNSLTELGVKVDIQHWENGRWVLWERAVITETGWEPA